MLKIAKNKKGVSLVELIAAIVVIAISSTTLTTMVITSYRGQLRAQQYILAEEIAKTYDSMFSRDVKLANLGLYESSPFEADDPSDKQKLHTLSKDEIQSLVKKEDGNDGPTFICLYSDTETDHFQLNDNYYDGTNVIIRISVMSYSFGYYKTEIIVKYDNGKREVKYNGSHYSE